ncbi:InlB B-repeat-containing protein [Jutongia sp.]
MIAGKKITEDAVILEELEGSVSDSNYKLTMDQIVTVAQSGSFHYLFMRIFKDDATRTKLKNYLSDNGSARSRENDPETDTLSPNMDLTVEIPAENFSLLKYRSLTADDYESTVPYDDEYVYGLASGQKTITYTQPVGGEEQTLSAQIVSEEKEPLNGEAVCEIMNLTTGETENAALTVTNGRASGKWTPLGTGYYKLTVKYQGDEEYYGAAAENPQYFTAYNSKKKTLPGVELGNTPVYGEKVSLQMSLAQADQVEDVTKAASFALVSKKDRKRTAITVENGTWTVNELPGEYTLDASITKDGVTYECSREIQIEKAQLYVTVDPVTVDVSKTTDYKYQFAASQLKFRGLSAGDEDAARDLFTASANEQEIGKDSKGKPYAADYSIYTGIKEDAENTAVNGLLAKYEVCTINSTLTYTGNKTGSYLVQYGAEGSGVVNVSTDKGTAIANGGSYAEDSKLYFKAVPAQGWNLKGWKVNGMDAELVQGVTFVNGMLKTVLTDDIQVTAVFEAPMASEKPAESSAPTQSPGESSLPVVSGKPQDPV